MAGAYVNRADSMLRRESDAGYRVAWKLKYGFQKGHFPEEMTYGEASRKAAELQAKEPEKVFWAEMIMDPNF
ncbi:MAG: hypothetical protein LOY58_05550 [Gammaproteobacteria bacterium]|nr:hypothetical protein [Gammaproteobacteria bacterium]